MGFTGRLMRNCASGTESYVGRSRMSPNQGDNAATQKRRMDLNRHAIADSMFERYQNVIRVRRGGNE